MNSIEEKNNFIRYIAQIFKDNRGLEISDDFIYEMLMNYGLTLDEINNPDIKDNFFYWINRYRNSSNMLVYRSNSQRRFLQFASIKDTNYKCYKLYVTFSKEDMKECVNLIFDFLDKNNIAHGSKVSDILRSDSVVLRISEEEDAKKVIDFINNNPYLNNKCRSVNPLLIKNGKVGMAYDDALSYNSVLSSLLAIFYQILRDNNKLKSASIANFSSFVKYILEEYFYKKKIMKSGIEKINKEFKYDSSRYGNIENLLLNYEEVIEVISCSMDKDSKDKYFELVKEFNDANRHKKKISGYAENSGELTDPKEILNKYIEYMYLNKLKEPKRISRVIYRCFSEENIAFITRDCNFRFLFEKYLSQSIIYSITDHDLISYVDNYINSIREKLEPERITIANKLRNVYNLFSGIYEQEGIPFLYEVITSGVSNNMSDYIRNSYINAGIPEEEIPKLSKLFCEKLAEDYSSEKIYNMAKGNIYHEACLVIEDIYLSKRRKNTVL